MSYGEKIEYYEQRQLKGYKTPLDDMPASDKEVEIYLGDYFAIGHFRSVSMSGIGSINLQDIISYYQNVSEYGELSEYIRIMTAIDTELLKFKNTAPPPKK